MSHGRLDPQELHFSEGPALPYRARPLVMGVVNITPDSFSDGGRYLSPERAVEKGLELIEEGADLLDLGAESTRPGGGVYGAGAAPLSAEEEGDRLLPVLRALRNATDARISVDTRRGAIARLALDEGADLLNDVDALADPESRRAAAKAACPVVLMHSRGALPSMQREVHFEDVVEEVKAELALAVERAVDSGIARHKILIDPGIGFGKKTVHNLSLIRNLGALRELAPVLLGASRKSFIGKVAGPALPNERLPGSLAAIAWAARAGAAVVRVHDVAETVQFLRVWQAIDSADGERKRNLAEVRAWT